MLELEPDELVLAREEPINETDTSEWRNAMLFYSNAPVSNPGVPVHLRLFKEPANESLFWTQLHFVRYERPFSAFFACSTYSPSFWLSSCRRLNHPNVMPIKGYVYTTDYAILATSAGTKGTLREFLDENESSGLPLQTVLGLAKDIANALIYLHSQGITYNILTSNNIVVQDRDFFGNPIPPSAVLSDVGDFHRNWSGEEKKQSTQTSSTKFSAAIDGSSSNLRFVDAKSGTASANFNLDLPTLVYNFGTLLWEIFTALPAISYLPPTHDAKFKSSISFGLGHTESTAALMSSTLNKGPVKPNPTSNADVLNEVTTGSAEYFLPAKVPPSCPRELANLIYLCWSKHAILRPSLQEIVEVLQTLEKVYVGESIETRLSERIVRTQHAFMLRIGNIQNYIDQVGSLSINVNDLLGALDDLHAAIEDAPTTSFSLLTDFPAIDSVLELLESFFPSRVIDKTGKQLHKYWAEYASSKKAKVKLERAVGRLVSITSDLRHRAVRAKLGDDPLGLTPPSSARARASSSPSTNTASGSSSRPASVHLDSASPSPGGVGSSSLSGPTHITHQILNDNLAPGFSVRVRTPAEKAVLDQEEEANRARLRDYTQPTKSSSVSSLPGHSRQSSAASILGSFGVGSGVLGADSKASASSSKDKKGKEKDKDKKPKKSNSNSSINDPAFIASGSSIDVFALANKSSSGISGTVASTSAVKKSQSTDDARRVTVAVDPATVSTDDYLASLVTAVVGRSLVKEIDSKGTVLSRREGGGGQVALPAPAHIEGKKYYGDEVGYGPERRAIDTSPKADSSTGSAHRGVLLTAPSSSCIVHPRNIVRNNSTAHSSRIGVSRNPSVVGSTAGGTSSSGISTMTTATSPNTPRIVPLLKRKTTLFGLSHKQTESAATDANQATDENEDPQSTGVDSPPESSNADVVFGTAIPNVMAAQSERRWLCEVQELINSRGSIESAPGSSSTDGGGFMPASDSVKWPVPSITIESMDIETEELDLDPIRGVTTLSLQDSSHTDLGNSANSIATFSSQSINRAVLLSSDARNTDELVTSSDLFVQAKFTPPPGLEAFSFEGDDTAIASSPPPPESSSASVSRTNSWARAATPGTLRNTPSPSLMDSGKSATTEPAPGATVTRVRVLSTRRISLVERLSWDANARDFWRHNFGLATNTVPWQRFEHALKEHMVLLPEDLQVLRRILDHNEAGYVSAATLGEFLDSHGPLATALDRVREYKSEPWFMWYLSHEDCVRMMRHSPPGTFVVRFSQSTPGQFALTLKHAPGSYMKCLVYSHHGKYRARPTEEATFTNLLELIRSSSPQLAPFSESWHHQPWFKGTMTAEDSVELMNDTMSPGDFFVRLPAHSTHYVLSISISPGNILQEPFVRENETDYAVFSPTGEVRVSVASMTEFVKQRVQFHLDAKLGKGIPVV